MEYERSNLEDQLLVMDAQDGNREAIEKLVIRWQRRLWQHAFRITRDNHVAWDVTQMAWYDIIRQLRNLNDPASFRAWAYKITTHKALDWNKKKLAVRQIPTESLDVFATKVKTEMGVDELMGQLDVDKRAILSLYYFEELSISEISATMKIPVGTVKSRLYNARNKLKELWKNTCE